jgi:hypothetical protein
MELSHEDQLRLNVMLANPFDAIRIDDSRMYVYALTGEDESRIQLNPTGRGETYLKHVRELLSGHALGSPGGYPVFLKRWTRMGQARADNLSGLLKLGEPEAVMAVAGAPGLTNELARCVWWANPSASIARSMLEKEAVINGSMGEILARYLVEYLPFETESELMIESTRLVLQPGLVDEQTRQLLWNKGKQKRAYHIGFLSALPDDLPEKQSARPDYQNHVDTLTQLGTNNPLARLLDKLLSENGQSFLMLAASILKKPANQDDVVILLNTVRKYFQAAALDPARFCDQSGNQCQDIELIISDCTRWLERPEEKNLAELVSALPGLRNEILAMLVLAHSGEAVVTPVLARTTAIGTVMRKRLAPVTDKLLAMFSQLNTGN